MKLLLPVWIALCASAALGDGDVTRGKELFRTCAGCHNAANDERKMGPSLRTLFGKVMLRNGSRADDANVRAIILDGYNGMPPFRYSFRPAEIDDLMAYLHTLTGKPPQTSSEGAGYFRAYCARCHDPNVKTATATDLRGRYQPEWSGIVEDAHGGAPGLKEWLDEPARRKLIEFLKTY